MALAVSRVAKRAASGAGRVWPAAVRGMCTGMVGELPIAPVLTTLTWNGGPTSRAAGGRWAEDVAPLRAAVEAKGGKFYDGAVPTDAISDRTASFHLGYMNGASEEEILEQAARSVDLDGVLLPVVQGWTFAAEKIPEGLGTEFEARRKELAEKIAKGEAGERDVQVLRYLTPVGVRIGSGVNTVMTPHMQAMNLPGLNASAVVRFKEDVWRLRNSGMPLEEIDARAKAGDFDTARDLLGVTHAGDMATKEAVIGTGNIGLLAGISSVTKGRQVQAWGRSYTDALAARTGVARVAEFDEVAEGAHLVTVHIAYTPQTKGMVDGRIFGKMAEGAMLMNLARGEVVDYDSAEAWLRSDPKATLVTDADLFVDADSRETTGPLEPTVALAKKFPAQVLAFPHVAADTDRSVRMVGRELAETHVVRALTTGRVTNAPAEGMLPAAPRLQSGFIEGEAYIPPHMRFVDRLKEEAHREEMARGASEGRN